MPKELAKAHENGDVYYHDLDSYNLTTNCLHIPTGELLQSGFNTGYGTIKAPRRIETAKQNYHVFYYNQLKMICLEDNHIQTLIMI